ncbi:hypothetical protein ACQQ64_10435 [Corynebacterium diphtheriae]
MQPNRNAIIEAEPIKPINECPTCGQPSKTMNKRRKDTPRLLRHKINAL